MTATDRVLDAPFLRRGFVVCTDHLYDELVNLVCQLPAGGQPEAQRVRKGHHELAIRNIGEDVVDEVGGGFGSSFGST